MDDFEDFYDDDLPPRDLLEKIRLAFVVLQESRVVEKSDDHMVIQVNRMDYEEFCSPLDLNVLH